MLSGYARQLISSLENSTKIVSKNFPREAQRCHTMATMTKLLHHEQNLIFLWIFVRLIFPNLSPAILLSTPQA